MKFVAFVFLIIQGLTVSLGQTDRATFQPNYDEKKVPSYQLPKLYNEEASGSASVLDWQTRERPRLLRDFEQSLYGVFPAAKPLTRAVLLERNDSYLGGKAVREQWELSWTEDSDLLAARVLVVRPKDILTPVPTFLVLNTRGNQEVSADEEIEFPIGPMRGGAGDRRGARSGRWPLDFLVENGFALATVYAGDFAPDDAELWRSRAGSVLDDDEAAPFGAISLWAWGLSAVRGFLADHESIDAGRIAVAGHSRAGKAALWAAANDERFWMAWSNCSGAGGAALSRRQFGETIGALTSKYGFWMSANARRFDLRENALSVDQHQLLALVAPRLLFVSSATEDLWADPEGERLALEASLPAWNLYSLNGTDLTEYQIREGKHDLTLSNWEAVVSLAKARIRDEESALTFVSYNLGSMTGWPYRDFSDSNVSSVARSMGKLLSQMKPTLLGVQEVPRSESAQAALQEGLGEDWQLYSLNVSASADKPRTVGLVVDKRRVDSIEIEDVLVGPSIPYWGIATALVDGQRWRVHVGKFDPGIKPEDEVQRLNQIHEMESLLRNDIEQYKGRVLVLADLNLQKGGPAYDAFTGIGLKDLGMFTAAGMYPTKHDKDLPFPVRRIDYVMLPESLKGSVIGGRIVKERPFSFEKGGATQILSDHLPVIVNWSGTR